jgi:hypothetical protein
VVGSAAHSKSATNVSAVGFVVSPERNLLIVLWSMPVQAARSRAFILSPRSREATAPRTPSTRALARRI